MAASVQREKGERFRKEEKGNELFRHTFQLQNKHNNVKSKTQSGFSLICFWKRKQFFLRKKNRENFWFERKKQWLERPEKRCLWSFSLCFRWLLRIYGDVMALALEKRKTLENQKKKKWKRKVREESLFSPNTTSFCTFLTCTLWHLSILYSFIWYFLSI